jgi:archaellum component FlaG (FlaF/FlaG flagellin family)
MRDRMKPYDENEDDVAAIGIGAMIVFIALILVAAVASTIIIKTAEELQQRAEKTGDDTRDEISGKLQIISSFVDTAAATHVTQVIILGQMSAGSDTVLAGDVNWFVVCNGGATMNTDTAVISSSNAALLDGTALNTATTAIPGGTSFTFEMLLTNCGTATGTAPGDVIELRIIIDGGGETYSQLEVGDLAPGSTLV